MRAGNLDRQVRILRAGPPVDDGYTTSPGALGVYCSRWASYKPANGRALFENRGREATSGGSFWLRFDSVTSGIQSTDTLQFEGRNYDIVSVTEMGRRDGIEIIATAADQDQTGGQG